MTGLDAVHVLPDLVEWCSARYGDRPALSSAGGPPTRALTHRTLAEAVRSGAATLALASLPRGDRILLVAEPSPGWLAALLAIGRAGLVGVPVSVETPPEMIRRVMDQARAGAVVASETVIRRGDLPGGHPIVDIDNLLEGDGSSAPPPPSRPDHVALLVFTSGSTSRPRAVVLTHANLLWNIRALLQRERATPDEAFLSMLPPAHLFELVAGQLGPLACGARIVYAGPLLPNRLLEALRVNRITRALVVPALLQVLYQEVVDLLVQAAVAGPAAREESLASIVRHLKTVATVEQLEELRRALRARIGESFRMLIVGGAAIDPSWPALCATMNIELDVGYGLTEAGPVVSQGRAGACPETSVGRPLPGVEVRIDGNGEILVRSPAVMCGYLGDARATADVVADGWLHTGDRGRIDDDGFLFVTGRTKEIIVTDAGITISPEEIEPHYADPLFAELCVVPFPEPHGNDLPVLIVVPATPAVTDEQIDAAFARLRAAAPPRCRAARVQRAAGPLPRTVTGKIRRRAMAEELTARNTHDATA